MEQKIIFLSDIEKMVEAEGLDKVYDYLEDCARKKYGFDGDLVRAICQTKLGKGHVVDMFYQEFQYAGRWNIDETYIIKFSTSACYSVHCDRGLTEYQEDYWCIQVPELATRIKVERYIWI